MMIKAHLNKEKLHERMSILIIIINYAYDSAFCLWLCSIMLSHFVSDAFQVNRSLRLL